eukprot:11178209-Lingulodinium_polyedra.AAC.1
MLRRARKGCVPQIAALSGLRCMDPRVEVRPMVGEPLFEPRDRSLTPDRAPAEHKEHKGVWEEPSKTPMR